MKLIKIFLLSCVLMKAPLNAMNTEDHNKVLEDKTAEKTTHRRHQRSNSTIATISYDPQDAQDHGASIKKTYASPNLGTPFSTQMQQKSTIASGPVLKKRKSDIEQKKQRRHSSSHPIASEKEPLKRDEAHHQQLSFLDIYMGIFSEESSISKIPGGIGRGDLIHDIYTMGKKWHDLTKDRQSFPDIKLFQTGIDIRDSGKKTSVSYMLPLKCGKFSGKHSLSVVFNASNTVALEPTQESPIDIVNSMLDWQATEGKKLRKLLFFIEKEKAVKETPREIIDYKRPFTIDEMGPDRLKRMFYSKNRQEKDESEKNPITLNLSFYAFINGELEKLMPHFPQNVTQLIMKNARLHCCDMPFITPHFSTLKSLILSGNQLGDMAMMTIAPYLPKTLEEFDVGGNKFGDKGLISLSQNFPSGLVTLCLRENGISDEGIAQVSSSLQALQKLKHLNLKGTGLGDKGLEALAHYLSWISLQNLEIQCTAVSDLGIATLMEQYKEDIHSLISISLRDTKMTKHGKDLLQRRGFAPVSLAHFPGVFTRKM